MVQWASPKTRIPYDSSSNIVRSEKYIWIFVPQKEYQNSRYNAHTVKSQNKERANGVNHALHYKNILCMLAILKCAIVSENPNLLIDPYMMARTHHET
jgi:hypothetical protein